MSYLNVSSRRLSLTRIKKKLDFTGSQLAEIVAGVITGATAAAQESLPPKSPPETKRNFEAPTDVDDGVVPTTRSITLGNGTVVSFTADDVPPPPAISFASREDIFLLNRMWDDTSAFWGGSSVLEIKGVPIPIVYWKAVYSQRMKGRNGKGDPTWKPRQWKAVKGHYFNWRVRVILFITSKMSFDKFVERQLSSDCARDRSLISGMNSAMKKQVNL